MDKKCLSNSTSDNHSKPQRTFRGPGRDQGIRGWSIPHKSIRQQNGRVSKTHRDMVYERDDGLCSYCLTKVSKEEADIDHVTPCHQISPVSEDDNQVYFDDNLGLCVGLPSRRSGRDDALPQRLDIEWDWYNSPSNYVLSCIKCNQRKGSLTLLEAYVSGVVCTEHQYRHTNRKTNKIRKARIKSWIYRKEKKEEIYRYAEERRWITLNTAEAIFQRVGKFNRMSTKKCLEHLEELRAEYKTNPQHFTKSSIELLRSVSNQIRSGELSIYGMHGLVSIPWKPLKTGNSASVSERRLDALASGL
jgi:5-methylcytosine-specific restriction endonuclease McrA